MTWASEEALEHALEVLAGRYPGEEIEVLETFDIAHAGWECDSRGALILHDGKPDLVIIDQVGGDDRTVGEILVEKVAEYRRLITDTERVLVRFFQLRAGSGDPDKALESIRQIIANGPEETEIPEEYRWNSDDDVFEIGGQEYVLQRVPGESDAEYEERKSLFEDLKKSGGRLSVRVEDLPESVIERLRRMADEYPDAKLSDEDDE